MFRKETLRVHNVEEGNSQTEEVGERPGEERAATSADGLWCDSTDVKFAILLWKVSADVRQVPTIRFGGATTMKPMKAPCHDMANSRREKPALTTSANFPSCQIDEKVTWCAKVITQRRGQGVLTGGHRAVTMWARSESISKGNNSAAKRCR